MYRCHTYIPSGLLHHRVDSHYLLQSIRVVNFPSSVATAPHLIKRPQFRKPLLGWAAAVRQQIPQQHAHAHALLRRLVHAAHHYHPIFPPAATDRHRVHSVGIPLLRAMSNPWYWVSDFLATRIHTDYVLSLGQRIGLVQLGIGHPPSSVYLINLNAL